MSTDGPVKVDIDIVHVDLKRAAKDLEYATSVTKGKGFRVYNKAFLDIIGESPTLTKVESRDYQFAHEAGVYIRTTNQVYFTANFQTCDPIELYAVDHSSHKVTKVSYPDVVQANGACNYRDQILYCSQGDQHTASALVLVDPATGSSAVLATNFQGRPFNSVNDAAVHHATDSIWFTDPTYGHEQAFRPRPQLPAQVYRLAVATGEVACVADGFAQCNGLCFSADYARLYVTDTGAVQAHGGPGDGHRLGADPRLPATIYEYDVVDGGTRLAGRRTFAFCDTGVPDGIKCDEQGNVYSGCGDGVHVWDPRGTLLGKIVVGGCVANFCFAKEGIWMFGEEHLYFCKLKARGALVKIECE
ncbi:hypothetical protein MBLNU459_g6242t1 [Dothideomycetes sp. NU459]